ncbi:glycosyl transferase family protein [Bradyrhizobium diazoefficiens]|nr:glycosyl transferase family protein [Bradyrhizobium diazoefficiens]MBR0849223.1 glycosyl transferase family protein [Bradyrhizobium diazoefficiens]
MDDIVFTAMFLMSVFINFSSLGDALIDLFAFGITRSSLARTPGSGSGELPSIGVFVANWHEAGVLGRMVEGNLSRITAPSVRLYLGVYPNDTETRDVALALAERYPDRVRVIVNTLAGPTSKGQMLNEMFEQVYTSDERPEMVVLHDSEDVIDPRTFEVYAAYAEHYDFIQVPVFALNSKHRSMVAATYMDEFAERHTREMIVRNALNATIPSAGVGTCMTRRVIEHFVRTRGNVLMTGCVTEDYILGTEVKRAGFKAVFAATSAQEQRGLDYVATREFFPKSLQAAIKQKTRWVYGINFEATRKLGWEGDAWDRYFFLRDRKGIVTNFLPVASLACLLLIFFEVADPFSTPSDMQDLLAISIGLNFVFLVLRYAVRVAACHEVYGTWDPIGIALRWPVALYINMAAVWRAWKIYLGESHYATRPIAWSKTDHEIPDDFVNVKR